MHVVSFHFSRLWLWLFRWEDGQTETIVVRGYSDKLFLKPSKTLQSESLRWKNGNCCSEGCSEGEGERRFRNWLVSDERIFTFLQKGSTNLTPKASLARFSWLRPWNFEICFTNNFWPFDHVTNIAWQEELLKSFKDIFSCKCFMRNFFWCCQAFCWTSEFQMPRGLPGWGSNRKFDLQCLSFGQGLKPTAFLDRKHYFPTGIRIVVLYRQFLWFVI